MTTVWVPVSPTSGSNQFPIPPNLQNISDLLFEFINPNPFDVVLEGSQSAQAFQQASWPGASWLVLARERTKIYISKKPMLLSAAAVATPGCPLPEGSFNYSGCYLGLVYGTGSSR
jgi:hypothetical protein